MNDELDKTLGNYRIPPASNDLADRIILAAAKIEQKQSIWQIIQTLFEEFKIPAPAYSFSSLLIISFVAGFITYNSDDIYNVDGQISDQILYETEDLL